MLQKAISKGLASADIAYSDKEIFEFMFAPGLSTADKVTELSGRGVGMDVSSRISPPPPEEAEVGDQRRGSLPSHDALVLWEELTQPEHQPHAFGHP